MDGSQTKRELRATIRARRRERAARLDDGELWPDAEHMAWVLLEPHVDSLPPGAKVAVYASMPLEPPTRMVRQHLLERGHEVLLPVVVPGRDELAWSPDDGGDHEADHYGIPTPSTRSVGHGRAPLNECSLVLVPSLAVDGHGHRLGQGGGFYDRLELDRQVQRPRVMTMVWEGEVVHDIRVESHDLRVDAWVVLPFP